MTRTEKGVRVTDSPIAPGSFLRYDPIAYYRHLEAFNITIGDLGVFGPDTYPDEVDEPRGE